MTRSTEKPRQNQRWVIKLGSALLRGADSGLNTALIQALAQICSELRNQGIEVVLVSSGAIANGLVRLGWTSRPSELPQLQVAAAVGQMGLIRAYQRAFEEYGIETAQVLLTSADLNDRGRYLNARGALRSMLALGIVPVVNENDTVATEEIQFGDNDTLGALVGNLIEADLLVILTDQEGLFDADPTANPKAQLVRDGRAGDPVLEGYAGGIGLMGRGGMKTKIQAAAKAARSGASTVICSGRELDNLRKIALGEYPGTLLKASSGRMVARKQWLAGRMRSSGRLVIDEGAERVLAEGGKSLLPVGVVEVTGEFRRGDLVDCVSKASGRIIARGLVNYSSKEAATIAGKSSTLIETLLGYIDEPELIHWDNLALL